MDMGGRLWARRCIEEPRNSGKLGKPGEFPGAVKCKAPHLVPEQLPEISEDRNSARVRAPKSPYRSYGSNEDRGHSPLMQERPARGTGRLQLRSECLRPCNGY